jgi:anaerobic selenocysteine-containing dehydrogenase/Fe-S-cluster-containing dehydrogenase component
MSEGMKRRDFFKVVGAGSATVATVGCATGEVERLIPYVIPSEDIVPGVPTFYTSTCRECPAGCGILVETHEGRVTKVEGNPNHPVSRGTLCARGQASVQGLYHPDRIRGPQTHDGVRQINVTWSTAERVVAERMREAAAAGRAGSVVFLSGAYTGTMERLVNDWTAAVGARRVVYEPFADQPRNLSFADADFLISFGADFLETYGSPVDYAFQFAQFRSYRDGRRGKFVWVGPHRPLTGLNADQWLAPRPGTEHLLAAALAGGDVAAAARETGIEPSVLQDLVQEMAGRRVVALGPGAGYAGGDTTRLRQAIAALNGGAQPPQAGQGAGSREMMQLIQQMRAGQVDVLLVDGQVNPAYTLPGAAGFAEAMQQVPMRVSFSSYPDDTAQLSTVMMPNHHFLESWDDYAPVPGQNYLVQPAMRPVFNTRQTGDVLLGIARALGVAAVSPGIEAVTYFDYLRGNWGAAAAGDTAWRDALRRGGIFAAVMAPADGQPTSLPGGASIPATGAQQQPLPAGQTQGAVGFVPGAQATEQNPAITEPPSQPVVATPADAALPQPAPRTNFQNVTIDPAGLNLVVYPSYRFFDGRTANRPWLLELPDPVTKVPWQSWLEIHPRAAQQLGIEQGDLVEVTSPHGSLQVWAYVYPGVRPDTVAIQMGLGHAAFGRWTAGRGVNPNLLLGTNIDAATGDLARYGERVTLRRVRRAQRRTFKFNAVPDGLFEQGVRVQFDRDIAQAVSLTELARRNQDGPGIIPGEDTHIHVLKAHGGFSPAPITTDPAQYPPPGTHFGEYIEGAARWAMVIDLERCMGCSACVIACNAENNIPVVGPKEMAKGRELHWLRIERYWGVTRNPREAFSDDSTDDTRFLPMLCQHCGNAPCEPVCPVYAAYHTPDGLNAQVYNRCVGTRYCANNCPYKVRVFNWFTYQYAEPLNWQLNPDVTVREKGVMEKCTFCVQRIRESERNAAQQNRALADGEIVPACVQTCPTQAMVFGNISDPDSRVSHAARSNRGYRVLGELNTQPAVVYLKKVTLHEPPHGAWHHTSAPAGAAYGPAEGVH